MSFCCRMLTQAQINRTLYTYDSYIWWLQYYCNRDSPLKLRKHFSRHVVALTGI